MNTIPAGWALVGKRPGSYDDISVIATSDGPFSSKQFHTLVFKFSPGNPPPPHEKGPAALPWIWFNQASIRGVDYVGIAIRDWTEHVDATHRPIAFTRYFCLPLEGVVSAALGFADLFEAVADIALPWDLPNPFAGNMIELRLPRSNPEAAAGTVVDIGMHRAAAAATRLFEGPVSLLGGNTDPRARLRTLDAIVALLPAGAKAWLTASTWADFGVDHPLMLTFAQRARDADLALDLRADNRDLPRVGYIPPYQQALVRLCEEESVPAVVLHLARLGRIRERDAFEAEVGLQDLALAKEVLYQARNRTLQPKLVRRLGEQDRLRALSSTEVIEVLMVYLAKATPGDLRTDRDLLAKHWSSEFGLARLTQLRLWETRWAATDLLPLADIAQAAGYMNAFAAGLEPPEEGVDARSPTLDIAGELIVRLTGEQRWVPWLARCVVGSELLTIAALKTLARTESGLTATWVTQFDAVAEPDSPWARLIGPCRTAYLGEDGQLSQADVEALHHIDPDLVADLLRAPDRASSRFGGVLDAVLGWLQRRVTASLPPPFGSLLRGLDQIETRHQASIDFMLYLTGDRPKRSLELSQEYRDALASVATSAELSRLQWQRFIETVAERLHTGWSSASSQVGGILETLWQLGHPPGQEPMLTVLARRVADEVVTHGELIDHPGIAVWLPELERDPRLGRWIQSARLARFPQGTSVAEVANTIIELLNVRTDPDELVNALINSRWRPGVNEWTALITAVTARWRKALTPLDADVFGVKLGQALMRGDFNGGLTVDQSDAAVTLLPLALVPQLMCATKLAYEAANSQDPRGRHDLARYAGPTLHRMRDMLDETLKLIEASSRPGLLRRVMPGSRPEERRADGER